MTVLDFFQKASNLFDKVVSKINLSNMSAALAGFIFAQSSLSGFGLFLLVCSVVIFLMAGFLLIDKKEISAFMELKNQVEAEQSRLRRMIDSIQSKHLNTQSQTANEVNQPVPLPVQGFGSSGYMQTPPLAPRRRLPIVEDNPLEQKTEKKEKPSPSTPPRPRRKTGA